MTHCYLWAAGRLLDTDFQGSFSSLELARLQEGLVGCLQHRVSCNRWTHGWEDGQGVAETSYNQDMPALPLKVLTEKNQAPLPGLAWLQTL